MKFPLITFFKNFKCSCTNREKEDEIVLFDAQNDFTPLERMNFHRPTGELDLIFDEIAQLTFSGNITVLFYGLEFMAETFGAMRAFASCVIDIFNQECYRNLFQLVESIYHTSSIVMSNQIYTTMDITGRSGGIIPNISLLQSNAPKIIEKSEFISQISNNVIAAANGEITLTRDWFDLHFQDIRWYEMFNDHNRPVIVESKKIRTGVYICGWDEQILQMLNVTHEIFFCDWAQFDGMNQEKIKILQNGLKPLQIDIANDGLSAGTKREMAVIKKCDILFKEMLDKLKKI